ncbi:caspase family protein [Streptomyces hirsutus]|uniref:caspase family protein n=1 Tax=Streptomyces hirsutus TaxID=35620 RepID=UPI0033E71670
MTLDPITSRVLVVGVSDYEDSSMENLPTVLASAEAFAALLREPALWGVAPDNCTLLLNPQSSQDVLRALRQAAMAAEDGLVVYFAGHGIVSEDGRLYLGLPAATRSAPVMGLSYDDVRSVIVQSKAVHKVIILDCCYSGLALTGILGERQRPADLTVTENTFVLTSSAESKSSLAPATETYTAFSGELIKAIRMGIPGPPEIDMARLFLHLEEQLRLKGRPIPQQRSRGHGGNAVLVRNRWRDTLVLTPAPPAAPPASPPKPGHRGILFGAVSVVTAVGVIMATMYGAGLVRSLHTPDPSNSSTHSSKRCPVNDLRHAG